MLIVGFVLLKAVAVGDVGNLDTGFFRQHAGKFGIGDVFAKQPLRVEVALLIIALAFDLFVAELETVQFALTKFMTIMNLRQGIHLFVHTHGKQTTDTDQVKMMIGMIRDRIAKISTQTAHACAGNIGIVVVCDDDIKALIF